MEAETWERQHWSWMSEELKELGIELTLENIPQIIDQMDSGKRKERHPERCTNWNCHPKLDYINCFFCACPHYPTNPATEQCKIGSTKGFFYQSTVDPSIKVWDCTPCHAYHSRASAENYLRRNFDAIKKLMLTSQEETL